VNAAGTLRRSPRPVRLAPAAPRGGPPLHVIGAFESTYIPAHDADILETSGHVTRYREDLALLRAHGVTHLRYPVRWHRIETAPGRYDWHATDEVLGHLREEGFAPILDLVHHTSYPRWLRGGFGDPRFGPAYLAFCEAFARRYPWVREYTLFNEPFATLFLCGHEAVWPPYADGLAGFVALMRNVLPAVAEASRRLAELLPGGRHVWVDSCEGHTAVDPQGEAYAELCNDRRFFALDAMLGRAGDRSRPFVAEVVAAGGADLLELEPGRIDVLGLDYYAHHEWAYGHRAAALPDEVAQHLAHPDGPGHPRSHGIQGGTPAPNPQGLAELARQYSAHAGLPMILGETNIAGSTSDRATWLKHTLEQCEEAIADGVPLEGYCWFGFLDSLDWNSLLERCDRALDPVGVIALDEDLGRHQSSVSRAYAQVARGARSSDLPAYALTPGMRRWIAGLLPLMEHYAWQAPPEEELVRHARGQLFARAA
jgi:beta-glucosidase/6-phospho-beta-glucosidase/beta-galactosidase